MAGKIDCSGKHFEGKTGACKMSGKGQCVVLLLHWVLFKRGFLTKITFSIVSAKYILF
jgi:hypothetical protein